MRKIAVLALALAGFVGYADDEGYGVVGGGSSDSSGYIQITEDLQSFGFTVSEQSSAAGGSIGYYTYSAADRSDKTDKGLVDLTNSSLDLGSSDAGTKIGFYYQEGTTRVYEYTLKSNPNGDGYLVQFDVTKVYKAIAWENGKLVFGRYDLLGSGEKASWISRTRSETELFVVGGISVERAAPTGMPLPGFLVALLLGGLGAGGVAARRRSKRA